MKSASFALLTLILAAGLATTAFAAAIPDGKVAVVRVTAIDGLAGSSAAATQTRSTAFSFDGTNYTIAPSAAASLDGVPRRWSSSTGARTRSWAGSS